MESWPRQLHALVHGHSGPAPVHVRMGGADLVSAGHARGICLPAGAEHSWCSRTDARKNMRHRYVITSAAAAELSSGTYTYAQYTRWNLIAQVENSRRA